MKKIYIVLLGLLLAGCAPVVQEAPEVQQEIPTQPSGAAEVQIKDFSFIPATIEATGKLMITNRDNVAHTFTVDELGIDSVVAAGQSVDIEAASGSYAVRCRFHPRMKAELVVG